MNHPERATTPTHWVRDSLAAARGRADVTGPAQFAGCAVIISHDRWFLDRIATHILAFEGESQVTFFDGNFTEYESWRKQQLGEAAARPHRIAYRKLTR
jgi:sulfate-transporting ATPase